jgi:hypothetical protein
MDLEEMTYFGSVGMHTHTLLIASGQTNAGGAHEHVWLVREEIDTGFGKLYEGRILFGQLDGAHTHPLAKGRTGPESGHVHAVSVRGLVLASSSGGAHDHEQGIQGTGHDGSHSHELVIGGLTLTSLTPADFHEAMLAAAARLSGAAPEAPAITRSFGSYEVISEGKKLSKHWSHKGAMRAAGLYHFLAKCGFHTDLSDSVELTKGTELVLGSGCAPGRVVSGGGLLGKMGQLVKDLD